MKLQIPPRASKCCLGHPFENPVISQLFKQDDGTWLRKDSCAKCVANEEADCTWQSAVLPKIVTATPLLERFQNTHDPKELTFLAEILLRQKQLLRRSRSKTEQIVENAVTAEVYVLSRPDLTMSEVAALSEKYACS